MLNLVSICSSKHCMLQGLVTLRLLSIVVKLTCL